MMKKIFTSIIILLFIGNVAYSQQDAMFTKYVFNTLTYNPAYAGYNDHMYVGLLHRTQWYEIDGAPSSQSFTAHTPLKTERIGVGLSLTNDVIGPTSSTIANLAYAYKIPLGNMKLSVGLQGGVMSLRQDLNKVTLPDQSDPSFQPVDNKLLPNFGAGIFLYSETFYVGFSSPHLVEYDLRDEVDTEIWAKQYRHYFASVGAAIPLKGDNLVFKPSILIKNVGLLSGISKDPAFTEIGAPTSFDIDLSMLFQKSLWVGASFRSSVEAFTNSSSSFDSADIWISYFMSNGLRIGLAYDYPLTEIRDVSVGAFEVMVGYEFDYETTKVVTPRYF